MAKENLTQRVLFDANEESVSEEPETPNRNYKKKGLPRYVTIPLVTAGVLGACWLGAMGICVVQNIQARNRVEQENLEYEEYREKLVLEVAQYKRDEPTHPEPLIDLSFPMNLKNYYEMVLDKNERKFIEKYRKDHLEEYQPKK